MSSNTGSALAWPRFNNPTSHYKQSIPVGEMMKNLFRRLWKEEEGQDLIEYSLLVVLIALIAAAAVGVVGLAVSDAFASI